MLSRLTRIFLALVTAFVFTGQMEAAAQHCARLAKAAAIVAVAEDAAPPCHDAAAPADMHAAMGHHEQSTPDTTDHHPNHSKAPPHCECIAALNGWTGVSGATVSTRVETYAWLAPEEASFVSSQPDPDFRPPRA